MPSINVEDRSLKQTAFFILLPGRRAGVDMISMFCTAIN